MFGNKLEIIAAFISTNEITIWCISVELLSNSNQTIKGSFFKCTSILTNETFSII